MADLFVCVSLSMILVSFMLCLMLRAILISFFWLNTDVVFTTIPFLNHYSFSIRSLVSPAVISVYRSDVAGDCSLEIVRIISGLIRKKGGKTQPDMINTFTYLPLHKEILEAQPDSKDSGNQKKKGKKDKVKIDDRALAKDLQEGEATIDIKHRRRAQTQILTEVFACYFR